MNKDLLLADILYLFIYLLKYFSVSQNINTLKWEK